MSILDEYRRNARECERMAEKAGNDADRASWLRLAASWLTMIKSNPNRIFARDSGSETVGNENNETDGGTWWNSPDKDSKASH